MDTCALLWLLAGDRLKDESRRAIREAANAHQLQVSPISAWEVSLLARKGRTALKRQLEDWFEEALKVPGLVLTDLGVKVLMRSNLLPGDPPSDPADRILISTARNRGIAIVTRDRRILGYGNSGHVDTIEC